MNKNKSNTASVIAVVNGIEHVYDHIKIVAKLSPEIMVNLATAIITPLPGHPVADTDIIRVVKFDNGFHVITGRSRVVKALAEFAIRVATEGEDPQHKNVLSARLISKAALNRTVLPAKPLSKAELEEKMASAGGIFAKPKSKSNIGGLKMNLNVFAKQLDADAKAKELVSKSLAKNKASQETSESVMTT